MNLNKLALEYRKTKNKQTLDEIFKIVIPLIKKKASYIYYIKWDGILQRNNKIEYYDIEQELYLKTLEILGSYDISLPFENYYYHIIRYWRPSFITSDFFFSINYVVSGEEEVNETNTLFDLLESKSSNWEIDFNEPLNKQEQEIFSEITINPEITQQELGKIFKVSQPYVNKVLGKIKKKIKR